MEEDEVLEAASSKSAPAKRTRTERPRSPELDESMTEGSDVPGEERRKGEPTSYQVKGLDEWQTRSHGEVYHRAPWRIDQRRAADAKAKGKGKGKPPASVDDEPHRTNRERREDTPDEDDLYGDGSHGVLRDLSSLVSSGDEPEIQGVYKHVIVNFDTGAEVSTVQERV